MPSRPAVISRIERADEEHAKGLTGLGVATVHEANYRNGLMHGIRPVTGGVAAGGTAITCLNFAGDNLMLHAAIDLAQPGDMIIVGVTAPSTHGMFGEMLATSCRARGVTGVVLDAAARDSAELRDMQFPVWARTVSAAGAAKAIPGWVNIPISCGGVVVFPGDVVVADDDGVVVVARADAAEVLEAATRRLDHEAALRPRFAAGESSLDTGHMRGMLAPYIRQDQP
jgi:4-hydroxy-4-methyl-2-oxoglutarate aldolase